MTTRVVAENMKPGEMPVSKVMTRNPVYVVNDTLAVEALQKMVQGKENGYLSLYIFYLAFVFCITWWL